MDERIAVRTEAQGRIEWVSKDFKNGGRIAANEVFVKIDPGDYQLRVDEAEALLQMATPEAGLGHTRSRHKTRQELMRVIRLLETRLEMAKRELANTEISLPYDIRVTPLGC